MGLFSRKEAKSSRQTAHRPRPSVSSEAQAASLRVRARRRLAGAVALVLAAVIILPMLLDGEPRPVPAGIDIAVPERNAPFNPNLSAPPADSAMASGSSNSTGASTVTDQAVSSESVGQVDVPITDLTSSTNPVSPPSLSSDGRPQASAQASTQANAQTTSQTTARPVAPPSAGSKPAVVSSGGPDRTDEALAILEGRAKTSVPATAAAATTATATAGSASAPGSFVLQVASYGTDTDAKTRLDKLKSEGVSNAFVEPATVNGKQTFRLRVGPFDSRAAAQAAQARLRTLGYDNGFITTK